MLYDCFKHWTRTGRLFIYSDLHFNDEENKAMCPNWISPEEQVAIINKCCHKNDTLLLLGDLGDPEYVKQIKANKVLVAGNHDVIALYRDIISEIYTGPLFIAEKILVSHEKIEGLTWCVNIHGHDHNGRMRYHDSQGAKHVNVAANVARWMPINLDTEIKNGLVSEIASIHRQTINAATVKSIQKKNKIARKNGEPEITYQRPTKKKKAPVQTQPAKSPEEKLCALRKRICLHCPNATLPNSDSALTREERLINGECTFHNERAYLVIDKTQKTPVRRIVPIVEGKEPPKCEGTQRLVKCANCPSMMATIEALNTTKDNN